MRESHSTPATHQREKELHVHSSLKRRIILHTEAFQRMETNAAQTQWPLTASDKEPKFSNVCLFVLKFLVRTH